MECLRHNGDYYEPLVTGRRFSVYRRVPNVLVALREEVADYEFHLYRRLLLGRCGRDDAIRPRTRLWRDPDGTYRASAGARGGVE